MINFLRGVVAGPKKKTPFNGNNLDLTYITDRIIAMAYPASQFFEKAYRNSIEDVADYFNQYHNNSYLIINVSSRQYDKTLFGGRVRDYEWPDHQAPTLPTLIQIAFTMRQFLEKSTKNVVAVHCNHGKGRTGTAIISFMLFMRLYNISQQARKFYNSRRFSEQTYGVDQPCQTRYLSFVEKIRKVPNLPQKVIAYKLKNIIHSNLNEKCYLTIKKTRTGEALHKIFEFSKQNIHDEIPLVGDVFIELFQETWKGSQKLARINYNLFFLNPKNQTNIESLEVTFKSQQIKLHGKGKKMQPFWFKMQFEFYCLCHSQMTENNIYCQCHDQRDIDQKSWAQMVENLNITSKINEQIAYQYFYTQNQKLQNLVCHYHKKRPKSEQFYSLGSSMKSLEVSDQKPVGMIKFDEKLEAEVAKNEEETSKQMKDMKQKMQRANKGKDQNSSEDT